MSISRRPSPRGVMILQRGHVPRTLVPTRVFPAFCEPADFPRPEEGDARAPSRVLRGPLREGGLQEETGPAVGDVKRGRTSSGRATKKEGSTDGNAPRGPQVKVGGSAARWTRACSGATTHVSCTPG